MASLETLTPDQRAVLDLVLRRGRSYDDIARLLAIDRAAVRARALAAFDEIGPETGISPESRALITDYLLGQLPEKVAEQTRERLAESPYDRAWARVVASELEPLAAEPLPEIPDGSRRRSAGGGDAGAAATADGPPAAGGRQARSRESGPRPPRRRPPRLSDRPSSRLGGAIMLGVGALVVVGLVVVLVVLLSGGSSPKHSPTTAASTPPRTSTTGTTGTSSGTTGTSTGTTGTSTGQAQIVGQVNLNPPSGSTGTAKGVALVVKDGSAYGIIIEAQNVAPNSHNAYAAWLYNSSTDSLRLGFVNPAVGKTGKLQVGSALPANAGHYKELLLTLETQSNPKTPGTIVLEGAFKGVPASS
ncbi:MAG TPA: sigma factor-like helix-turn-helix DNA-binding protein [Solirubrobacteraceae bacterium]|nr:sigma factor-like helix-turn-helix DNA-binding protein [Solirubrobacteraceae bacterium]